MLRNLFILVVAIYSTKLLAFDCRLATTKMRGHFEFKYRGKNISLKAVSVKDVPALIDQGHRVTALDVNLQPKVGLTVIDHHGAHMNPRAPYLNTAIKIINRYTKLRHERKSHHEAVTELYQWAFNLDSYERPEAIYVTSDNVFDADFSLAILLNPSWLESTQLRVTLKEMAYFQDFGVFRNQDQVSADAELKMKAIMHGGDAIIEAHKDFMAEGDRLKADLDLNQMHVLMAELENNIKVVVEGKPEDVAQRARAFDEEVGRMIEFIRENAIVPSPFENSSITVFDLTKVASLNGVAKLWRAIALTPTTPFQVQVGSTQGGQTKFILAGRSKETQLPEGLVDQIRALVPESERMGVVQRDSRLISCFSGISIERPALIEMLQRSFSFNKSP